MKAEKQWINTSRFIGMVCVYLYHSEIYGLGDSPSGYLFTPFFMAIFYFVSGYLFFSSNKMPKVRYKNILNKMLWPYFIFCSLIYFPKMIVRGWDISFSDYFIQIAGGYASWFIASLIVLQLIVVSGIKWIRSPKSWFFIGIVCLITVQVLKDGGDNSPWYCLTALQTLPIFSLGGIYYQYEDKFIPCQNWWIVTILGLLYVTLVALLPPIRPINNFDDNLILLKIFVLLLGMVFVIFFSKIIPSNKLVQYIGRNTLPMYFMSGGFPLLYNLVAGNYLESSILTSIIIAIVSLLSSLVVTWLLKKYFPFVLDISLFLKRNKVDKSM